MHGVPESASPEGGRWPRLLSTRIVSPHAIEKDDVLLPVNRNHTLLGDIEDASEKQCTLRKVLVRAITIHNAPPVLNIGIAFHDERRESF